MTRAGGIGTVGAALGLVVVLAGRAGAEPRKLLVTKVSWVDAQQNAGTMLFQGTVDASGVLRGRVYAEDGAELVVTGTVASDGGVTGALDTTASERVGTFAGQLNGQREIEGEVAVDGTVGTISWEAPADALPSK